jgi:hypothetical protein
MKLKFKKLHSAWKWLANQTRLIWHWIRNLFFVFFTTKSTVRIFEGYGHWWFAKKYADRRAKMSKINEVCGEKRHFVLPWGNYSLIVLNKIELNTLKSKGIINKKLNVLEIFKHAYYLTK